MGMIVNRNRWTFGGSWMLSCVQCAAGNANVIRIQNSMQTSFASFRCQIYIRNYCDTQSSSPLYRHFCFDFDFKSYSNIWVMATILSICIFEYENGTLPLNIILRRVLTTMSGSGSACSMYVNQLMMDLHVNEHIAQSKHSQIIVGFKPNAKQIKWEFAPTPVLHRSGSGPIRGGESNAIYIFMYQIIWLKWSIIAHRQREWIRKTYVIIIHSHDFISTESRETWAFLAVLRASVFFVAPVARCRHHFNRLMDSSGKCVIEAAHRAQRTQHIYCKIDTILSGERHETKHANEYKTTVKRQQRAKKKNY